MKILGTLFLFLLLLTDPTKIGKINSLKAEAKKAYEAGDFKTAISKYRYLVDSLHVKEDEVLLNLANAYFQANDTTNALNQYQTVSQSPKNQLRSKAEQQLGVMANRQGKPEEALNHFKQAIKSDLTNEDARYNYELLKKKLEEKKKQEQQQKQDQKQDQEKKDQQDEKKEDQKKEQDKKEDQKKDQQQKEQEQKENEQKKKDQEQKDQQQKDKKEDQDKENKSLNPEKPEKMKIPIDKAKMILDAMRENEKQYLQQNKRKATKSKDKGKPDW